MINRSALVKALIHVLHLYDDAATVLRGAVSIKDSIAHDIVGAELLTVVVFFRPIFFLYAVFMSYLFLETASGLHSVHACAGKVEEFHAPVQGTYKLEVWGAQGGNCFSSQAPRDNNAIAIGGKGGYSIGKDQMSMGVSIYVCVGGKGGYAPNENTDGSRGYNGGGLGDSDGDTAWGGGGGCTSITSSNNGTLNNFYSITNNILIVAGGGGGSGEFKDGPNAGGVGGGVTGGGGQGQNPGRAGTQTNGGANALDVNNLAYGTASGFGYGGNFNGSGFGSGGGGGYYGGGCGYTIGSSAGGGSGYVNTSKLTDALTIAGNTSFPSPTGGTETGHAGNGWATISLIR